MISLCSVCTNLCLSVYKCNFRCVICCFMQFLCVHSKTVVKLHCFLSFISFLHLFCIQTSLHSQNTAYIHSFAYLQHTFVPIASYTHHHYVHNRRYDTITATTY